MWSPRWHELAWWSLASPLETTRPVRSVPIRGCALASHSGTLPAGTPRRSPCRHPLLSTGCNGCRSRAADSRRWTYLTRATPARSCAPYSDWTRPGCSPQSAPSSACRPPESWLSRALALARPCTCIADTAPSLSVSTAYSALLPGRAAVISVRSFLRFIEWKIVTAPGSAARAACRGHPTASSASSSARAAGTSLLPDAAPTSLRASLGLPTPSL